MFCALLGYIGPETALPAMSVLAAAAGIALGLGRYLAQPFIRGFCYLCGRKQEAPPSGNAEETRPEPEPVVTSEG
jgi:hypothetical protein